MERSRTGGFTLIEILVVLLIVSVMSGIVVVNMPSLSSSSDFDEEVKRLHTLLQLARDEALMQSAELGFRPDRDRFGKISGYSFLVYDDLNQTWTPLEQAPFRPRSLEEGVLLQLFIEGDSDQFRLDDEQENLPPVMLLSSGETTPFELTVYREPDLSVTLKSDGYSPIERVVDEG